VIGPFWVDSVEKVDRKSRVGNNRIKKAIPSKSFFNTIGRCPPPSLVAGGGRRFQEAAAVAGAMASTSGQLPASWRPFKLS
jgi:hypothetical protein